LLYYIIHAAADAAIAAVLKTEIERLIPGLRVFVASKPGDIPTGADWLNEIQTNLREAQTFILLLTPRSVGRQWVWYESGVAWLSRRRTLPVVAAGLDVGNIPYPLGAAQALQLENADHAAQLFRDLGADLDDPAAFVRRIRDAVDLSLRTPEEADGWRGVRHDGGFFAWEGPLAALEDRDGIPPPGGLLDALKRAGMTPTWGSLEKLERHIEKGRNQVFQTDQRAWRRPVVQAADRRSVLLVHVEDDDQTALRALSQEIEFNASIAERAGTDQLGTEFSLDVVQKLLTTGIADRFGSDLREALLQARGAVARANQRMEAALQFPKGSNSWGNAMNSASQAIVESRRPLAALRDVVQRYL
jgi:hypothetical protein